MKAIIHIGTAKTGSTSIQNFLHTNRSVLRSKGIAYLKSPGLTNHRKIVTFCMDSNQIDDDIQRLGLLEQGTRQLWKEKFRQEYLEELDKLRRDVHTVLISSEHFHSRLISYESIVRLVNFLSNDFSEIKVLVYLRRQDKVAVSLYSTALRGGKVPTSILPKVNNNSEYYNYNRLLSKWSKAFGRENVVPRIFENKKLISENLVSDMITMCNIHKFSNEFIFLDKSNQSLSAFTQEFIRIFNKNCNNYSKENKINIHKLRGSLIEALQKKHKGSPMLPSRQEAYQFYSKFKQSNQKVADEWFNGELFELNFDEYPVEGLTAKSLTIDDVMIEFITIFKHLKSN